MNPAYLQLLQKKNLLQPSSHRLPQSSSNYFYPIGGVPLTRSNPNQQPAVREQGFGGHFKDAPPEFMITKTDNKIERMNPPKKTKKRRRKKPKK